MTEPSSIDPEVEEPTDLTPHLPAAPSPTREQIISQLRAEADQRLTVVVRQLAELRTHLTALEAEEERLRGHLEAYGLMARPLDDFLPATPDTTPVVPLANRRARRASPKRRH